MRLRLLGPLHLVAGAGLVLRLIVAWWSERISHADELFQYLEQAHRLVYGYGFMAWEYRFGLRNWLLPGALAAMLETLRAVGLDQPSAYLPLMRSMFALVSVSAIYASYGIGRNGLWRAGRPHCRRVCGGLAPVALLLGCPHSGGLGRIRHSSSMRCLRQ